MKLKRVFLSVFLLVTIVSCSNKTFDSEVELMKYIQDQSNGFTQKKTVKGIDFSLLYRPTDIIVSQGLGKGYNKETIERLRKKYRDYMYFNLSMSSYNKELLSIFPKNRNEFGIMVNQLAFEMKEKIHVFTPQKDTLEMSDFIYPRMYGMSEATTIMLVYPRDTEKLKEDYLNLTIEDLGTNTGEIKFKIPKEIINNEPILSFKN